MDMEQSMNSFYLLKHMIRPVEKLYSRFGLVENLT